jgi:hypothetical protein
MKQRSEEDGTSSTAPTEASTKRRLRSWNSKPEGIVSTKNLSTRRSLPQIVYGFSHCSYLTTNTLEEYAVRYVFTGSLARLSTA